jgi:hypothetical protein
VRWFAKNKPGVTAVYCRATSKDLYWGAVDHVNTFTIDGDYSTVDLGAFNCRGYDVSALNNRARKAFPDYEIITPHPQENFSHMDFDFTPHPDNKYVLDRLLKYVTKELVVVAPRYRSGKYESRNYKHWDKLNTRLWKKYHIYSAGVPEASEVVSPLPLSDFVEGEASVVGLTIEALRRARCCVGSQSAIPILSNLIGTRTVMWGHEKQRHAVDENTAGTECKFIESPNYDCKPEEIMQYV